MSEQSSTAWQLNTIGKCAAGLQPCDLLEMTSRFQGEPEAHRWEGPAPYQVLSAGYGFKDFVGFMTAAPVTSIRAKAFIEQELLTAGVEFLTFGQLSGRDYYLLNITRIIDAVDFD